MAAHHRSGGRSLAARLGRAQRRDSEQLETAELALQRAGATSEIHGQHIFDDDIEAWAHGLVVPSVYHQLKGFRHGALNVNKGVSDGFTWDDFRDVQQHLLAVWTT